MKKILTFISSSLLAAVTVAPAFSATINFTGTIGFIEKDDGSSMYSGLTIGESFSGNLTYGDSSLDASAIDIVFPISADYSFTGSPYGGFITNGSISTTGIDSVVGIGDNDGMGDDAEIINNLYGPGSTTPSTIADTWNVDSSNGAKGFGLTLYSLDTLLFTNLDFQALSPTLGDADFAIFYIGDADNYLATGILTSVTAVPVPAAVWLFGSGILGLYGFAHKKSNIYT